MEVGSKVESNITNEDEWLIGEIVTVNEDETYNVKFENDEVEKNVSVSNIRTIEDSADYSPMNENLDCFEEGSRVEIDKDGNDKWLIGTIINHNRSDATYDVIYEKSKEFGTQITGNRIRFISENAQEDSDEEDEPIVLNNDETVVNSSVADSNNDTVSLQSGGGGGGGDKSPKESRRKESKRSKRSVSRSRSPLKDRKSDRHSKKRSSRDRSRSRDKDSREGRGERSRDRGRDRSEGRERRKSFDEKKDAPASSSGFIYRPIRSRVPFDLTTLDYDQYCAKHYEYHLDRYRQEKAARLAGGVPLGPQGGYFPPAAGMMPPPYGGMAPGPYNPYGAPPAVGYGGAGPAMGYGMHPPQQYGMAPPHGYGIPQPAYGHHAPSSYGIPPAASGYGLPPAAGSAYGAPPQQSAYGAPPVAAAAGGGGAGYVAPVGATYGAHISSYAPGVYAGGSTTSAPPAAVYIAPGAGHPQPHYRSPEATV